MDIYAQFSMSVVVSSMEPVYLASILWKQCPPERWQWPVALWQLGEVLLLSRDRYGGICSSIFIAVSWYPAQHVMLCRVSILCNTAVGRYLHVISTEFSQIRWGNLIPQSHRLQNEMPGVGELVPWWDFDFILQMARQEKSWGKELPASWIARSTTCEAVRGISGLLGFAAVELHVCLSITLTVLTH